jgi:hypothetical protein
MLHGIKEISYSEAFSHVRVLQNNNKKAMFLNKGY